MLLAFVIVSMAAAAALTYAAVADLARYDWILQNMDRARVPRSWLTRLGLLKAAGALGLIVGIFVPFVGIVASVGLIGFFVGAVITHLAARWYSLGFPVSYLVLVTAPLLLGTMAR